MNPIISGSQPSLKFWGEEKTTEAIYMIYLKKVRYHHGIKDSPQVSHLEWETVRIKVIKAGTLEKLVESLTTDSGELESTYMNIFLSTYRSFASPTQVLTLLLNRYEQLDGNTFDFPADIKKRHIKTLQKIILVWLDMYPDDFYEPPQFLNLLKIQEFSVKYMPGSMLELRVKHKFQKFTKGKIRDNIDIIPLYLSNNENSHSIILNFLDIPPKHFALQLTYADNELFKKLIPHHCLGSAWSRRDKAQGWTVTPTTVTATVHQFNAVSLRVISTILSDLTLKSFMRAEIITKWIVIAQELRLLKNFSSLKAITAALQSNSIHRLTKVWLSVTRDKMEVFTELANIFSEENNQTNCRELLVKEGSAKFVDSLSLFNKPLPKGNEKHSNTNNNVMQGTIPYLGTFLTDLTMIDAAIPDFFPNGLINFDKRRKEFEILAQIKLLQSAANNYDISPDTEFQMWFNSLTVFNEKESYDLSCLIEPPDKNVSSKKPLSDNLKSFVFKWGHHKSDSLSSTSSSNDVSCDRSTNDISMSCILQEIGECEVPNSSCSSPTSLNLNSNQLYSGIIPPAQDYHIIKVSLQQSTNGVNGINLYKSIMLHNSDRTRTVIINAMAKHGLQGDPDSYLLAQLVPGGEIVFPDSANVYYAVNSAHELNFILKRRQENSGNENFKK